MVLCLWRGWCCVCLPGGYACPCKGDLLPWLVTSMYPSKWWCSNRITPSFIRRVNEAFPLPTIWLPESQRKGKIIVQFLPSVYHFSKILFAPTSSSGHQWILNYLLSANQLSLFFFFFLIFIFERARERERERERTPRKGGGGMCRERGGQRIWSRLCTDSSKPGVGLKLTNLEIVTWAEVGRIAPWATQAPPHCPYSYWWLNYPSGASRGLFLLTSVSFRLDGSQWSL